MKFAALSCAYLCAFAVSARAQLVDCALEPSALGVRAGEGVDPALVEASARQLAAGLAASAVQVCLGEGGSRRLAEVELELDRFRADALRVRIRDDVTHKTLERSVPLAAIPTDSRAVALALYVEELLQASWAELSLTQQNPFRPAPPEPPRAVLTELGRVWPTRPEPARPTWLWLAFGVSGASYTNGFLQLGPELALGVRALPWLDAALRAAYNISAIARATHGSIETHALQAGVFLAPRWQLSPMFALHFPQGLDAFSLHFSARAGPSAAARDATRAAVVVSHGLGLRVSIAPLLAVSTAARFCWALLAGTAQDETRIVTGIARVGAEVSFTLEAYVR